MLLSVIQVAVGYQLWGGGGATSNTYKGLLVISYGGGGGATNNTRGCWSSIMGCVLSVIQGVVFQQLGGGGGVLLSVIQGAVGHQ